MLHKRPLVYEWGCVPGEEKNEALRGREISDAGGPNVSNCSKNSYFNERTCAFKTQNHLRNKNKSETEETSHWSHSFRVISWQIWALLTNLNVYIDSFSCALEGKKSFTVAVTLERGRELLLFRSSGDVSLPFGLYNSPAALWGGGEAPAVRRGRRTSG